jgi:hypothetical protein
MKAWFVGKMPAAKLLMTVGAIAMMWASGWVTATMWSDIRQNREVALGVRTLRSLYEFENLTQFDENVDLFETLVTPHVFHLMSADNSDRILRVYLKFNGRPSYVDIIETGPNYVIYSLVCAAIERERLFLFIYEVEGGKVTAIREAELFAFATTRGWNVDRSLSPPLEMPFGGD